LKFVSRYSLEIMKNGLFSILIAVSFFAAQTFAQQNVIINNPIVDEKPAVYSNAEENLIKERVLPKARKHWGGAEVCTEEFQIMGKASGAFTKAGAAQTLLFYQFCQVGNGYGYNGLVLVENNKIVGSYVSDGGWAVKAKKLPDINQNGLDEFALYYSGGMHQGAGGIGVDVFEFSAFAVKPLGWFQSEGFTEEESSAYKVSVKPGKIPVFYREKYDETSENKWKKVGKIAAFKLGKVSGTFSALK
jgi:hypothetical protein